MASTLMTAAQVEAHVNSGLPDSGLETYIAAADLDIRRLVGSPLDNFRFSGVVVKAVFTRDVSFLRDAYTPLLVPGADLKIEDGLSIGDLEYSGSPNFRLQMYLSDDSTVDMNTRFPADGTYRRKESVYLVNGDLYAEIPAHLIVSSSGNNVVWYVPESERSAIDSIDAGESYEFVIADPGVSPLFPTYRSILIDLVRLAVGYDGLESERIGEYSRTARDYHMERSKVLNRLMLTQGRAGVLS